MKRYNNLYGSIIDKDNIRLAHKNARKGKTSYTDVMEVDDSIEKYVDTLHNMLSLGTYSPSAYTMFKKNDKINVTNGNLSYNGIVVNEYPLVILPLNDYAPFIKFKHDYQYIKLIHKYKRH